MNEEISIDDLANPRLTEFQQQALDYAASQSAASKNIDLSMESILEDACKKTGMSDFGPEDFKERLSLLTDEWHADKDITNLGRMSLRNKLLQHAQSRLLIQDKWNRHPEILDITIEKPIIVAGLPRSGTTHLLNLMAADSRLRALPLWESYEPVPLPSEEPPQEKRLGETGFKKEGFGNEGFGNEGVENEDVENEDVEKKSPVDSSNLREDPRYQRCAHAWEMMQLMTPLLSLMHPMNPDHIHEELELMGPDFASYNYEWLASSPGWRDHYLSHDQTPHYRYMKNVLKLLIWQQRQNRNQGETLPERWVLKCPQHLEQLPVLSKAFEDATIVFTHRDPVAVIQSAATMIAYGQRINRKRQDTRAVISYWSDRIEKLLRACVRDRDCIPPGQSLDVFFHEFMTDNIGKVEQIYQKAELPTTQKSRKALEAFITGHQRGQDGRIIYHLRRDFGLEPKTLRQRFSFYFDRFPAIAAED